MSPRVRGVLIGIGNPPFAGEQSSATAYAADGVGMESIGYILSQGCGEDMRTQIRYLSFFWPDHGWVKY